MSSMITITNAIFQAYQLVNKPIISMIIGTIVKIVTSHILIGNERINIYGAPISTFLSITIIVTINLYYLVKRCGKLNSIYSLFIKPFIATVIAIICGVCVYLLLNGAGSSKTSILATIITVGIIYILCVLKLKVINKNEILMLPKGESLLSALEKFKLV